MSTRTDLGRRFRDWISERGLLTLEVAALMGIGVGELSAYEHGRSPWPDELVVRIETLLTGWAARNA